MEIQFSKGKTIVHIIIYVLLYFAGDLLSSLAFDLLFSMIELPIRGLYSILRILGCLIVTYVLFWLYTTKIHDCGIESRCFGRDAVSRIHFEAA